MISKMKQKYFFYHKHVQILCIIISSAPEQPAYTHIKKEMDLLELY